MGKGHPSAVKILLLAGQALAFFMGLPQCYIGIKLYLRVSSIFLNEISMHNLCVSLNPLNVITESFGVDTSDCLQMSLGQNMTLLADKCGTGAQATCDAHMLFEWIGFLIRPIMLGLIVHRYFFKWRMVTLKSNCGAKVRITLARIGFLDFMMYMIQNGEISHPASLVSTISLIAYLRFSSAFILSLNGPWWVYLLIGLAHCAACAEGLLIVGMTMISLHSGVARHDRILGIFTYNNYLMLLTPLSSKCAIVLLLSYGVMSAIHLSVLNHTSKLPLYLICVFGYPGATVLCAWVNKRSIHTRPVVQPASRNDGAFIPNGQHRQQRGSSSTRAQMRCSFVDSVLEISAEDLLYPIEIGDLGTKAWITNYDLFRFFDTSKSRIKWAPNDERSEHLMDSVEPRGIAYVENSDVLVQLNDAALHGSSICEISFDDSTIETKSVTKTLLDKSKKSFLAPDSIPMQK